MSDNDKAVRGSSSFNLSPFTLPEMPKLGLSESVLQGIEQVAQQRTQREKTVADAAAVSLRAAGESVACLRQEIAHFEQQLAENLELALFVIGGPSGSFFPTSIQPVDPDKLIFRGVDQDGRPVVIMQHISQMNFEIRAVKVAQDEAPRRIGFHHPLGDDQG